VLSTLIRYIKIVLIVLACLAAVVFGALFTSENADKIQPVLIGVSLPQLALGYYLVLAIILGIIIGSVLTFLGCQNKAFQAKRTNSKLKRRVAELEKRAEKPVEKNTEKQVALDKQLN